MKILIDIGHPAHIHYFKNLANHLLYSGSEVLFTCREKEFEIDLLRYYGFAYKSFGRKYKSTIGKILGMVKFDVQEFLTGLKFKPDLLLSAGSIYAAHASFLLKKPHISLEDTGNMEQIRLYLPFTEVVLVPSVLKNDFGSKMIRFEGINELAYLHPNKFDKFSGYIPITLKKPYAILRFVSWNASHDMGQNGLDIGTKRTIIKLISEWMNVYISSEADLPSEFKSFQINIKPEEMHTVLANAELFVGEGATMAAESGVLGTPAIYVNSLSGCNNEKLAKYGLVFNYPNSQGVIEKLLQLLSTKDLKSGFISGSKQFVCDNIDVSAFLIWFVKNYPESLNIMKHNPDYQLRFK